MSFIDWDDSLSVGNPAIDQQHHQLVDLVNELHEACQTGTAKEYLIHVFSTLVDYIELHFRTEETLFTVSAYPHTEEHIAEHLKLVEEVHALKEKFDSGNNYMTIETLNFVREWVMHHIKETDMGYKNYI